MKKVWCFMMAWTTCSLLMGFILTDLGYLVQEFQDPIGFIRRTIQLKGQLRNIANMQTPAQLAPNEGGRLCQSLHCLLRWSQGGQDAHKDLGVPKIRRDFDRGHGYKTDSRILDLRHQDVRDFHADLIIEGF